MPTLDPNRAAGHVYAVLAGEPLPPSDLPFSEWYDALGMRYFREAEVTGPYRAHIARSLGHTTFEPPPALRPRFAVVLRLADIIRHSVGAPVNMRNAWRPADYNARVGGAASSDHILACGVDLDFRAAAERAAAELVVRGLDAALPALNLSLGLGLRTLHVGALSPKGRRQWYYSSYPVKRRAWGRL